MVSHGGESSEKASQCSTDPISTYHAAPSISPAVRCRAQWVMDHGMWNSLDLNPLTGKYPSGQWYEEVRSLCRHSLSFLVRHRSGPHDHPQSDPMAVASVVEAEPEASAERARVPPASEEAGIASPLSRRRPRANVPRSRREGRPRSLSLSLSLAR